MRRTRITGLSLIEMPPRVEASLWRRLRFEYELGCRETIFQRYYGLARSIARQRRGPCVNGSEVGDVEHFAYEGLLQAIDRFDPLRGIPFSAYARRRITGSILNGEVKHSEVAAQASHRSRKERDRLSSLGEQIDLHSDPLGTLSAVVCELAIGLLLDDTGMIASEGGVDFRPNAYDSLAVRELQAVLRVEVSKLPQREASIVQMHYEQGISFTHIAELLKLSKGRVSQLHGAALIKLRTRLRRVT